jgi:hypothetical protein
MSDISKMKELTTAQMDVARENALQRVKTRIGDKPVRSAYRREFGALWTSLDVLALVIFVAALAISSLHILAYAGKEAASSYDRVAAAALLGIQIDSNLYGVFHQLGFIALSESAMLLFFVLYRSGRGVERWLSLALALAAMAFVVVANLSSGLNVFLSLLAPAFTIGIGFRLEALIAENLRRNREVDHNYRAALETWEIASVDPAKHPDYRSILAQEIWQKLMSLKANAPYADAPAHIKRAAVHRELAKQSWAADIDQPVPEQPEQRQPGFLSVTASPNGVYATAE